MKKKSFIIVSIIIFVILLIFFLPIPKGSLDDGGTRVYDAMLYKIVIWNKIQAVINEDGSGGETYIYHKTSVFWFSDKNKNIDELWKMEQNENNSADGTETTDYNSVQYEVNEGSAVLYDPTIDTAYFDIDGDGMDESCRILNGPTSGLFSIIIEACDENGNKKYANTYVIYKGEVSFGEKNGVAGIYLNGNYHKLYVQDGNIMIENLEDEFI